FAQRALLRLDEHAGAVDLALRAVELGARAGRQPGCARERLERPLRIAHLLQMRRDAADALEPDAARLELLITRDGPLVLRARFFRLSARLDPLARPERRVLHRLLGGLELVEELIED